MPCGLQSFLLWMMEKYSISGSVWLMRIIPLLLSGGFSHLPQVVFSETYTNYYLAEDWKGPSSDLPLCASLFYLVLWHLLRRLSSSAWLPPFLGYSHSLHSRQGHLEGLLYFPLSGITFYHCLILNVSKLWFHLFCPGFM